MKYCIPLILLLFFFSSYSQTKKQDVIKQISQADTVFFTVDNSGCFDAYIRTYKLCKQRSGGRKVIYTKDTTAVVKKITTKNYDLFIKNYKASFNHFNNPELVGKCTSTSDFELGNKKKSSKFKNTTCEANFNPEMLLLQLMK